MAREGQLQRGRGTDRARADDGDLGRARSFHSGIVRALRPPALRFARVEIVLALGAALAWGFADFASGVKSRTNSTIVVTAIVLGAGGLVSLVIAFGTEDSPTGRTVALALAAGAATGLGVSMFFHALAVGVIGTVAPITCAGHVGAGDLGPRPGRAAVRRASWSASRSRSAAWS